LAPFTGVRDDVDTVLIRHRNEEPVVDPTAYIAPGAVLMGRVRVGPRCRVLSGAVLDAEGSRVELGECVIVGEHAVLRATAAGDGDQPVLVGDHVFISPHTTLLGCSIEAAAYIATGATVLHGASVGAGAVAAVGALIHGGAVVPPSFFIAPGLVAVGDPLSTYAPGDPALPQAIKDVGFARRAFAVDMEWEDRVARYRQVTEVRSAEFEAHFGDQILTG
jgi:carbonic anhydrase/acetyltransferase-like protein (isoleucine patch superfamily)